MKEVIGNISKKKYQDIFLALASLFDKEEYNDICGNDQIGIVLECLTEISSEYANLIEKKNFFSILPIYNKIEDTIEKLNGDKKSAGLSMHVNTVLLNIKAYCKDIQGIK